MSDIQHSSLSTYISVGTGGGLEGLGP